MQVIRVPLSLLMAVGFVMSAGMVGIAVRRRRVTAALVMVSVLWVAVVTRTALVALIEASAFPAVNLTYLSPAIPLAVLAGTIALAVLVQERRRITRSVSRGSPEGRTGARPLMAAARRRLAVIMLGQGTPTSSLPAWSRGWDTSRCQTTAWNASAWAVTVSRVHGRDDHTRVGDLGGVSAGPADDAADGGADLTSRTRWPGSG